jgi:hypothetical protein
MAKFVAFLGEKGGSGKSSLGHLLAHGLGSLPKAIDAVVVTQGHAVLPGRPEPTLPSAGTRNLR